MRAALGRQLLVRAMVASATIYALCDPVTGERRYIGKARDLPHRLATHRNEARTAGLNTHKDRWIRSLGDKEPWVQVLEVVPLERWAEAERSWIVSARACGARLTNFADGGQTSPVEGKGHTAASKAKMRATALRLGIKPPSRRGRPVSVRARENMRAAAIARGSRPPNRGGWNKGRRATPEEIEKNRAGHVGKPWSAARRAAQERRAHATKGS